jgi:hypothetical protein
VPHNLDLAAFSPGTVNVLHFDPTRGADQCRSYACKYCGKPEPWYYLETKTAGGEANPVKRYFQARNVGLCMCHNRLLGFHVVRSTCPTLFVWPQFVVPPEGRMRRTDEHIARLASYPDKKYYLNQTQMYFFRNEQLRHLRPEQFFRYFVQRTGTQSRRPQQPSTEENTADDIEHGPVPVNPAHRHYDAAAQACAEGAELPCSGRLQCAGAVRRKNLDLCVPRSRLLEPIGADREAFSEQMYISTHTYIQIYIKNLTGILRAAASHGFAVALHDKAAAGAKRS